MNSLLKPAIGYAHRGAYVFPCKLEKKPLTPHGFQDATRDLKQISAWWIDQPMASIGIACGASGWLVIDIDPDKGGFESYAELRDEDVITPGDLLTFTTRTGGGGMHIVWLQPEGVQIGNSAGKLGPGLDIRGYGGYIIAPPSRHPSGNRYQIEINAAPVPAPARLVERLVETPKPVEAVPLKPPENLSRTLQKSYERVANAGEGVRNDTLNKAGFYLFHLVRDGLLNESEVRDTLYVAAQRAGLEERETLATINSAYRGALGG